MATDYRSLDKQATELILTLGVHEPGKEADLTADLVLKGLAKLSKEERALQAELVSLVGGYRTAATEQNLRRSYRSRIGHLICSIRLEPCLGLSIMHMI